MAVEETDNPETLVADSAWGQIIGTRKTQQDDAAIVNWPNGFSLSILAMAWAVMLVAPKPVSWS